MSYCTIANVRSRNPLLLSVSSVSDSVIEEYIDYAGGIIDGYLSSRYTVPLSSVPSVVKGICADLAGAEALSGYVGNTGTDDQPNQAMRLRQNALALLDKIAEGKISAGLSSTDSASVSSPQIYAGEHLRRLEFQHWDPMYPKNPRPGRHHG